MSATIQSLFFPPRSALILYQSGDCEPLPTISPLTKDLFFSLPIASFSSPPVSWFLMFEQRMKILPDAQPSFLRWALPRPFHPSALLLVCWCCQAKFPLSPFFVLVCFLCLRSVLGFRKTSAPMDFLAEPCIALCLLLILSSSSAHRKPRFSYL